jgi:uncharacterized DUF497 family protein
LAVHALSFPTRSASRDTTINYGEDRFTRVGMVEGALLFVAYTERGERIRIISARRATKDEQDDYYQENGQAP